MSEPIFLIQHIDKKVFNKTLFQSTQKLFILEPHKIKCYWRKNGTRKKE